MLETVKRKPGRPSQAAAAARAMLVEQKPEYAAGVSEVGAEPENITEVFEARRWAANDIDDWLLDRLTKRWPSVPAASWPSRLNGFSGSNAHFFIVNDEAVLLAEAMRNPITLKPMLWEVFAFARDGESRGGVYTSQPNSKGNAGLTHLYRQMRDWGRSMNATKGYIGVASDITPANLRQMFPQSFYAVEVVC